MAGYGSTSPDSSNEIAFTETGACFGFQPNLNQSECYMADQVHPTYFLVFGILIDMIVVVGLIGNTLSIYVFSRPHMKSPFNLHLLVLSSFDIGVLITFFLRFGVNYLCYKNPALKMFNTIVHPSIMPIVWPSSLIAMTGSVWMTVAISVERLLVVLYPLRAKTLCTYKRAVISVISVTLFAICFNIPAYFISKTVFGMNPTSGETRAYWVWTCLKLDVVYIAYDNWGWLFVIYLIPFTTLAILNIMIYWEVRRSHRKCSPNVSNRKETKLALMLVVVVTASLFLNLPDGICYTLSSTKVSILTEVQYLAYLLTISNSSINFFIYCMLNRPFRVCLVQRLRLCVHRKYLLKRPEFKPQHIFTMTDIQ